MQRIFRAALITALLVFTSCVPSSTRVNWPQLVDCAPGIPDLLGVVSRILTGDGPAEQVTMGDRAKEELERLAVKEGPDTVACVVERLVTDWTAPGAAAEPSRLAAAARGRHFLQSVGTKPHLAEETSGDAQW